jgi:hypothetical protein
LSLETDFEKGFMPEERAIKFINEFKNLDLEKIDFDTLKDLTIKYFPFIPMFPVTIPYGTLLYRARTIPYNQPPYDKLADFKPPGKQYQKNEFGRANKPFQTVFYCSTEMKVAAMEVCKDYKNVQNPQFEVGWVVIGVWKVIDYCGLFLSNLCFSDEVLLNRKDIQTELSHYQKQMKQNSKKNPLPDNTIKVTELLINFFSEEFSKNNIKNHNDYKLSTVYADRMFSNKNVNIFDGLRYPSVPMKYLGDNIVLSENSYKNKLELVNTFFITCGIDFPTDDHIVTGILLEAEKIDGEKIVWEKEWYKHNPDELLILTKEIDAKNINNSFNDIFKMDDRHSFRASVSLINDILEKMIISFLVDHISNDNPVLFEEIKPEKNFSFSVRLAYHLGLLSELEFNDLQIVNSIDELYDINSFEFSYEIEAIKTKCFKLQFLKSKKPPDDMLANRSARDFFKINITFLAALLNTKIEKIEHLDYYDFGNKKST